MGFVVIGDMVFGATTPLWVDPSEEEPKAEFAIYPPHEIVRIDQVERRGTAKIIPLDKAGSPFAKAAQAADLRKPTAAPRPNPRL
jgi:hypothetical protein